MVEEKDYPKILVLIGGILGIIQGITLIFSGNSWYGAIVGIIFGIVVIIGGLALIISSGYLKMTLPFNLNLPFEFVPLLVAGIVEAALGAWWGGVCVVIAAVLVYSKK